LKETLHIAELLRIIKNHGDESTRNLFRKNGHQTRERRLIRIFLRSGGRASELELAKAVFGPDADERDNDYVVLRSQLKKRLLGQMGHLTIRAGSPRLKALYSTARALFRARVLLLLGARRTAMQILPKALKVSREFGLTQRAIECLDALTENAAITGNHAEFVKYDAELQTLLKQGDAEREANRIVNLMTLEYVNRVHGRTGSDERAREMADRCKAIFAASPSYDTGLAYYRMEVSARQLARDHASAIACTREAEAFFESHPLQMSPSVIAEFSLQRLLACFQSARLEEGFEAARKCDDIYIEGTNNWFNYKTYEFLLYMHSLRFAEARALLDRMKSNPRYYAQSDVTLERWQLFDRYLRIAEGEAPSEPRRRVREQTAAELFRDFARDVPIYARDKAGFNIALLILHVYVLLATNRRGEITMRTDVMPRYLQRHLKGQQSSPTAGFLKTLIYLERCSFDLAVFLPKGQKHLDLFLAPQGKVEIEECQALPYPFMWQLFVELLAR
jgi:hypothetical protein